MYGVGRGIQVGELWLLAIMLLLAAAALVCLILWVLEQTGGIKPILENRDWGGIVRLLLLAVLSILFSASGLILLFKSLA